MISKSPFGRQTLLCTAAAIALTGWTRAASAQDTSQPAVETGGLQEIVVTAQRRQESQQKVPISVSAFSDADLTRLSINEPRNLQFSTPGLTFPEDNGTVNPYIRGKGTGFSGPGLEGSVAFYIDDVYIQDQYGVAGAFVDVQQIEVLKGPQGVLYGRNATGGAIVISTRDPGHEFGGHVEVGYGNLDWKRGQAVLNLPVGDTLAFRFVAAAESRDGHLTNVVDGREQGRARKLLFRAKALWEPTDSFSALLKGEYQKMQSDYQRRQILDGFGEPVTSLGFYETYQSPRNPKARGGEQRFTIWAGTLRLAYETDSLEIVNTTGYRTTRAKFCSDNENIYEVQDDFCTTNDPASQPGLGNEKVNGFYAKTFTNEFRVTSKLDGPFNFMVGAYYQHSKARFPAIVRGTLFEDYLPALLKTGPLVPFFDTYTKIDSYAAFAEVNYSITPELKITLGGRYSKDKKKVWNYNNDDVAIGFGIPAPFFLSFFEQEASFDNFTPRAIIAYDAGDANYYVSYQKGFKSGGFNSPTPALQVPLRPEEITGFEAGAKFKFFDNRVRLNLAAFHAKSKNVQVASINPAINSVEQRNAARAKAYGFEADMQIAASERLTLSLGAAYLHSRFTSFPDAAVYAVNGTGFLSPASEDLKGFPTTNSPDFTMNASATYTLPLVNDWEAAFTISGFYSTEYDLQAGAGGPNRVAQQDDYGIVNLTGRISSPGDRLTLSWYVNNLFQTHYYEQINVGGSIWIDGGGGAYGVMGLPRTYGGSVRYTF